MSRSFVNRWCVLVLGVVVAAAALAVPPGAAAATYRSTYDVAYSPDGKLLAASDYTAGAVVILDGKGGKVLRQVALKGKPARMCWSAKPNVLYVAETEAGTVAEVDAAAGKVLRRFDVGPRPVAVAVAPKKGLLLATNMGLGSVSVVDLKQGKETRRIDVLVQPHSIAVDPAETIALVGNLVPVGDATDANHSACVSVIDLKSLKRVKDIKLTSGSTLLRSVIISPDGKWAYAAHTLGRFTLPTTQLDRGWINTNAMSVIDLAKREAHATVLLDRLTEGAADPWGLAISKDGKTLWVTLSGVHQIGQVDLESLHLLMAGKDIPKDKPTPDGTPRHLSAIWGEIKKDPAKRPLLANDLAALYGAGLLIRTRLNRGGYFEPATKLQCAGLRGVSLSPDGKRLAIAGYFTGNVAIYDPAAWKVTAMTALGKQPAMDSVRRGEVIFHDATYSFQHWLSCATCHPDGARADGLNWDLLNDGIGNPKNSRSLLLSHKTPPVMSRGVRSTYAVATTAGFRFILFREPEPDEVEAVKDYLRALAPDRSPYLTAKGELTAKAKKGKAIFEDGKTGCLTCHPAPLYTDLKMYDVGTRGKLDRTDKFDTPTLIELWRTPPFLHDGAAKDLREVLTTFNKKDKHGKTSHLSKEQIDALVEYLLSL